MKSTISFQRKVLSVWIGCHFGWTGRCQLVIEIDHESQLIFSITQIDLVRYSALEGYDTVRVAMRGRCALIQQQQEHI